MEGKKFKICEKFNEKGWREFFERRIIMLDYNSSVFTKEGIFELLNTKDLKDDELIDKLKFELKFENFDYCVSVEREIYLNKERFKRILTETEKLIGVEIRKKYDRKELDNIQSVLRTEGIDKIWRMVDREAGIYLLLFTNDAIDLKTDMNNINMR